MRDSLDNFEKILSLEKVRNLLHFGASFFDVDDTLLARRKGESKNDQVFSESSAASAVPLLLNAGVNVCIITGHGWAQLKKRFVTPLIENASQKFPEKKSEILGRLFIYANRGATRMVWQNDEYKEDAKYNHEFSFNEMDSLQMRKIFVELTDVFNEDFSKRRNIYQQNFPKFDFSELPPKIFERENVVLGLRPIPAETHSETAVSETPRQKLFNLGSELLKTAGMEAKYELAQSGKSTLEFTRKAVSKKIAFADLLARLADEKQVSGEMVEECSIYVGDEFSAVGNDLIIAQSFPKTLCFSVSSVKSEDTFENVIFLEDFFQIAGVAATSRLISYILNFLT